MLHITLVVLLCFARSCLVFGVSLRTSGYAVASVEPLSEESVDAMKDKKKQTYTEIADVVNKTSEMDLREMVEKDLNTLIDLFMPGKRPDFHGRIFELVFVVLAVLWIIVYLSYIYKDDRSGNFEHWLKGRTLPDEVISTRPDVVLVFPNPARAHGENSATSEGEVQNDVLVKNYVLQSCLSQHEDEGHLERTRTLLHDDDGPKSLRVVREALLKDIVSFIPGEGIHVHVFTSLDGSKLLVCLTLRDEKWVRHYVTKNRYKLRLNRSFVENDLGISPPTEEFAAAISDPPVVLYDHHLATEVFGRRYDNTKNKDAKATDGTVFQTFASFNSILNGVGRIRVVITLLMSHIDLDKAAHIGLITTWFPCHTPSKLERLTSFWAKWRLLLDLSCVQPLPLIQEYFSSRVAFVFAWNGMYAKLLLALLPCALFLSSADAVDRAYPSHFWKEGSILGFSLIVLVWGRIASNLWRREEEYLRTRWDLDNLAEDGAVRPDFQGTEVEWPVAKAEKVMEYPAHKRWLRWFSSWCLTLLTCTFVLLITAAWLDSFGGHIPLVGAIVQAVMIQVFTFLFNRIVGALTVFENNKFQSDYYRSYLLKVFVFQFINQYSAFAYIATKQQLTEGCVKNDAGERDCLLQLKHQLPQFLLVVVVMDLIHVVTGELSVKFATSMDHFRMARKDTGSTWESIKAVLGFGNDKDDPSPPRSVPPHNFIEMQSKYKAYRAPEQIDSMMQLVLNLGFVFFFGSVVPIIIPMCAIAFMVSLRAHAIMLTSTSARPIPRRIKGLGEWLMITDFLLSFSAVSSAYFFVNFGTLFEGTQILTRLSGAMLYIFFTRVCFVLVDIFYQPASINAAYLRSRHEYIITKFMQNRTFPEKKQLKDEAGATTTSNFFRVSKAMNKPDRRVSADFADAVLEGRWDDIPRASELDESDMAKTESIISLG